MTQLDKLWLDNSPRLITRRDFLRLGGALFLFSIARIGHSKDADVIGVRIWPAKEYTRVTLEFPKKLVFENPVTIKNPHRLFVDIQGVEMTSQLAELAKKVGKDDPYIEKLRVGTPKPGIVRLVLDLKTEVIPQMFTLDPIDKYGYRVVLDLYPLKQPDPFQQLVKKDTVPMNPDEDPIGDWITQYHNGDKKPKDAKQQPSIVKGNEKGVAKGTGKGSKKTADKTSDKSKEKPKTDPAKNRRPVVARMVTIMLDPGHGGEDPGAVGPSRTQEKVIVLSIAKRLKHKIDDEPNMRALLTRDGDYFIPLNGRVRKARDVKADLFISIHADAFIKPTASGSSVFMLSEKGASSSSARWLADKQNLSDRIGGVNVKDKVLAQTLLDLSQTATMRDSGILGNAVLSELGKVNKLHNGKLERAGFAVLKAPDIPSVLVETAFISNHDEEAKLVTAAFQEEIANAILNGIRQYFTKNPIMRST